MMKTKLPLQPPTILTMTPAPAPNNLEHKTMLTQARKLLTVASFRMRDVSKPDTMEVKVPTLPTDDSDEDENIPEQIPLKVGATLQVKAKDQFFVTRIVPKSTPIPEDRTFQSVEARRPEFAVEKATFDNPVSYGRALCATRPDGIIFYGPYVTGKSEKPRARESAKQAIALLKQFAERTYGLKLKSYGNLDAWMEAKKVFYSETDPILSKISKCNPCPQTKNDNSLQRDAGLLFPKPRCQLLPEIFYLVHGSGWGNVRCPLSSFSWIINALSSAS